jgi:hypothetical protein
MAEMMVDSNVQDGIDETSRGGNALGLAPSGCRR